MDTAWTIAADATEANALAILGEDRRWNGYSIADLAPPLRQWTRVATARRDDRTAAVLFYQHPAFNSTIPHGDPAGVAAILDGAVLVAHGASWDVGFLEAEMARAGRPDWSVPFYIDTLQLSRRTFALAKHSLDALAAHFGLDRSRAHRADADVTALRDVFARCIDALEPTTPRDVWQVRIAEGKAREQILRECREAAASGRVVHVTYRPRAKAPMTLTMVIQTVNADHDPPHVTGYLLPGRGRKELRADRILRIEPEIPGD